MKEPVIVSSSEVMAGCWATVRFNGGICPRLESCSYPEKKTCKAHTLKTHTIRLTYKLFASGVTMTDHDYDQDPIMRENFLYVGDTVIYKGQEAVVETIVTIENSALDGRQVHVVPWVTQRLFTVTLTNGHWAYGEQIQPLKKSQTAGSIKEPITEEVDHV